MPASPALDEVLASNKAYLASGQHRPDMKLGVSRRIVVLTCMDSRLLPEHFLGLKQGEAEVIRNGGGRVTEDVIRSLIVCQDVLSCNTIFVIHHTDCGAHAALYHPSAVVEHAKAKIDEALGTNLGGINMHPIYDLDQSVRDDVAKLRAEKRVKPDTAIYGLVFQTESGQLREICRDEGTAAEPAAP
ncbi:hypothetical protein COHA_005321 [Chlorella ohadii]|uniref:Carbonic anhydrase n=1 Tax=Chlorella ohadii TaxID=2649997 RepID=A0AAD5DSC8_9CHLO|nr:hypothetical protein COHA_005321 [Chlorella ohadii]